MMPTFIWNSSGLDSTDGFALHAVGLHHVPQMLFVPSFLPWRLKAVNGTSDLKQDAVTALADPSPDLPAALSFHYLVYNPALPG